VNWWRRAFAHLLRLFGRRPLQLAAPSKVAQVFGSAAELLDADLQDTLKDLTDNKGVVTDTVAQAIRDHADLREVMMGPGATTDAVDDVTLIAESEAILRDIILRAPDISVLVRVASSRPHDKEGRESAGEAILGLKDEAMILHELASAALRWGASRSQEDSEHLRNLL
jgi:hypothetical protein